MFHNNTTLANVSTGADNQQGRYMSPMTKLIIIYIILFIGLVGNTLIIILMARKRYRRFSYAVHLTFIASVDSLVLITVAFEDTTEEFYLHPDELMGAHLLACKLYELSSVCHSASVWFVTILTVDRFVSVYYPFKHRIACTKLRAILLDLFAITVAIGLYTPELVLNEIVVTSSGVTCMYSDLQSFAVFYITRELLIFALFPVVVIFIINILVIHKIKLEMAFRRSASNAHSNATSNVKATVSLTVVSLMELVCVIPITVVDSIETVYGYILEEDDSPVLKSAGNLWPILNNVKLLKYALTFYIIVLTGKQYRSELFRIFQLKRDQREVAHPYVVDSTRSTKYSSGSEGSVHNIVSTVTASPST